MNWYKTALEEYVGSHSAPDATSGAPLHDLTGIFPDDIYSAQAVRYYGHNGPSDYQCISIIQAARNNPNLRLTVYRAIPMLNEDLINHYEKQKAYILKYGKMPPNADNVGIIDKSDYYDYIYDEIIKLQQEDPEEKLKINNGDWVAITRQYAKQHGESNLNGKYKILSKLVKASELYTNGDSIQEWGYHS